MYRITFDGSVADEHGFVAMGGQADQVAGVLKERYTRRACRWPRRSAAAIAALAGQGNGDASEINASQLEVAVLVRGRAHRTFRRLTGAPARGAAGRGQAAARPASRPGARRARSRADAGARAVRPACLS